MQDQELRNLSKELRDNLSRLQSKRSVWESHWQEVADYCLPRKADVNVERSINMNNPMNNMPKYGFNMPDMR